jgi:hypothetical protein
MEGNKLKHNFVKKDIDNQEFIRLWQNYTPQSITFENRVVGFETIVVSEQISDVLLRYNDYDNYLDFLKKSMSAKLASILLENNFINIIEEETYYGDKKITMKLNVQKI